MYIYDTHVHTSEVSCCGWVSAKEVVKLYNKTKASGIVITDHFKRETFERFGRGSWNDKVNFFMSGYHKAKEEGEKTNINVLFGMEVTFDDSLNDFLVLGLDEYFIKHNKEFYRLDLQAFREMVSNEEVLIYQAHPYRPFIAVEDPKLLDGIEVYNANMRHNSHNEKALKFAVDKELRKLAGSDFHRKGDEARGGIILDKRVSSTNELVQILKSTEVKIYRKDD